MSRCLVGPKRVEVQRLQKAILITTKERREFDTVKKAHQRVDDLKNMQRYRTKYHQKGRYCETLHEQVGKTIQDMSTPATLRRYAETTADEC